MSEADLQGPLLKIRRAESEIQRLAECQEAFQRDADYEIVQAEFNHKTARYVYRARVGTPPDPSWGVYVGEIAHNLRSALDGLVYQLVLANGGKPTRATQFPIFLRRTTARRHRPRRGKGRGSLIEHFEANGRNMLQGVRADHEALIERLQPYKRANKHSIAGFGRDNALYLLNELNNADKHRLLQVVGAKPGTFSYGHWGPPLGFSEITGPGFAVLKDGTKVMEAAARVKVVPKVIPLIAFSDGCKPVRNRAVIFTLGIIKKHVELILEQFSSALR